MNTEELIEFLSIHPQREITVSVDIGTDTRPHVRCFGNELIGAQCEGDGKTITLLFECGEINGN
jgi:hypothetical protein